MSKLAGFAKKDDLRYLATAICGIDYVHVPLLAPTQTMLEAYRKENGAWEQYERNFLKLLSQRQIETNISKDLVANGCLLCSEDKPDHCHRRLVAEYLQKRWGKVIITHL